jgi:hypothetical protein
MNTMTQSMLRRVLAVDESRARKQIEQNDRVVNEHRSRRLVHYNVTPHPSAAWTLQQLREAVGYEDRYRFLVHDRDCIFASQLDDSTRAFGIRVPASDSGGLLSYYYREAA